MKEKAGIQFLFAKTWLKNTNNQAGKGKGSLLHHPDDGNILHPLYLTKSEH